MDSFEFRCPYCKTVMKAEKEWGGRTAKCPICGKELIVPQIGGEADFAAGTQKAAPRSKKLPVICGGLFLAVCAALCCFLFSGKGKPQTKTVQPETAKTVAVKKVIPAAGSVETVRKVEPRKVEPRKIEPRKVETAVLPVEKIPECFLLSDRVPLEMVKIPKGSFVRGDGKNITISRDFWIGKYELTRIQWNAIMKKDFTYPAGGQDLREKDLPQDNTSWIDGKLICRKLNEKYKGRLPEGYRFSMPTMAQWEYACRAGSSTAFSYGDVSDAEKMNFDGTQPYGGAEPVKWEERIQKTVKAGAMGYKNAFGLYDMHGNVSEWCLDYYNKETSRVTVDPVGLTDGKNQSFRGGSYLSPARECMSSCNLCRTGNFVSYIDCGLRIALVPVGQ